MRKYLLLYFIPALLIGVISCQRDDDEPPARELKAFSRLYISTSDYQAGASTSLNNVWVIDSVDQATLPKKDTIYSYESAAKGGRTIHYSANGGLIFHGSINTPGTSDTAVQVLSVNLKGNIGYKGKIANRRYDNIRGLFYTVVNNGLLSEDYLLALNKSNRDEFGNLFVFNRPQNSGSFRIPSFRIPLDYVPWGVTVSDKDVYVVKTGAEGGIVAYKELTQSFITKKDTLLNVDPNFTLTIKGSSNLRGISYSKVKDVLVMTDYSIEGNTIQDGRILIFDNFSSHATSKEISPTRIIQGVNSKLVQPMDIAIDPRVEGKYIYVADPGEGAKKVYRFSITDEGDIAPNAEFSIKGRTPQSISLDAR